MGCLWRGNATFWVTEVNSFTTLLGLLLFLRVLFFFFVFLQLFHVFVTIVEIWIPNTIKLSMSMILIYIAGFFVILWWGRWCCMFLWEIGGHTKKNQKEGNYAWNHNCNYHFWSVSFLAGRFRVVIADTKASVWLTVESYSTGADRNTIFLISTPVILLSWHLENSSRMLNPVTSTGCSEDCASCDCNVKNCTFHRIQSR
mgnify:CR=1 FL=1